MLGKIEEIIDNTIVIKLDIDITKQPNLVNLHNYDARIRVVIWKTRIKFWI